MQNTSSWALPMSRTELYFAGLIARLTIDGVDDLESDPRHIAVRGHRVGAGTRVPCLPHVVQVADGVRAVPGPHQLLGGIGLALAAVQRQTATAELRAGAARTGIDRAHRHSVPISEV